MRGKYFIDTNIFVYTFDSTAPHKQKKAQEIIKAALDDHHAIISFQVVQEFLNVALRHFSTPMTPKECQSYLKDVLHPLWEIHPNYELYQEAIQLKEISGFSFYDSLIVASAKEGRCKTILSEDLQSGQVVGGLKIKNPFL